VTAVTTHVLTLSCPDTPGIVHAVTGAIVDAGGNITSSQQFEDPGTGTFFMRVAVAPEIAAKWLFADHVLAGLHRLDDHRRVQIGRRADIDDVDIGVGDQLAKTAVCRRNVVAAGELDDLLAPRRDGLDLDIDAIDPPVGVHVQLGHKAAAGQADPDFRHVSSRPCGASGTRTAR